MPWKSLKHSWTTYAGLFLLACLVHGLNLFSLPTPPPAAVVQKASPAAVMLNGKALFTVQGVLSFPADARAAAISRRIEDISKDVTFNPQSIAISDSEGSTDLMAGDLIVMSVTDQDAKEAGKSRQTLAQEDAQHIASAMMAARREYSLKSLLSGALYTLLSTVVLLLLFRLMGVMFPRIYRRIDSWRGSVIPSLRIQKFELLPADRIANFLIGIGKLLRLGAVVVALYFYISLVLGFFPWTRGYAQILFGYVLSPLRLLAHEVVAFLPDLFFIVVIVLIARFAIKAVRIIFAEIGKQTITLQDFYPEWAEPTYKIVRVLILAVTAIAIFPYLPGSKSPAFQGVSIFLGVLLSLGSTSAVANMVAGVILTYMRAFKIGDRVQIADTVGDVLEKTLLVTRVRSIKNVEITIANSMVLSSHIINFSSSAQQQGLILHTSVTIGYDAPWRRVHQLLIDAALACENILQEPRPFVFQTALDDFYVHYEINAYTDQPSLMAKIYSDLHEKIQDKFNEAGVEIMSSHYANMRDGNRSTIPGSYLPSEYVSPSFRVGLEHPSASIEDPAGRHGGE